VKIKSIEPVKLALPPRPGPEPVARRPRWSRDHEVANPMSKYPHVKAQRSLWAPKGWRPGFCKVTAEDGTWGLGMSPFNQPVAGLIRDHLGPQLVGHPALATERLWDMMTRMTKGYGAVGLPSCAVSAVDLALWDLKGKVMGRPVYELLGGPAHDSIFCYATTNDIDWSLELGFEACKLSCPYGPVDGLRGMDENERLVAGARELMGPGRELMLDTWMAFDVEYTVRLAERLRPYNLRWIEDPLSPDDWNSWLALRQQLPWQTIASGEHWFLPETFAFALSQRLVSIIQPDVQWCGGITAAQKIVHLAEANGIQTVLHSAAGNPYGQHFTYAMPSVSWAEFYIGGDPGVPLAQGSYLPGTALPDEHGRVRPSDAPGFGIEIKEEWLVPFFG
jgi:L-rhamnonate dehydratase